VTSVHVIRKSEFCTDEIAVGSRPPTMQQETANNLHSRPIRNLLGRPRRHGSAVAAHPTRPHLDPGLTYGYGTPSLRRVALVLLHLGRSTARPSVRLNRIVCTSRPS